MSLCAHVFVTTIQKQTLAFPFSPSHTHKVDQSSISTNLVPFRNTGREFLTKDLHINTAELLAGVAVARRKGEIKILKKFYEVLSKLVNEEYTMHSHIHSHNMLHGEII